MPVLADLVAALSTGAVDVGKLPPLGAVVIVGPLPIVRGSGSPCRALALVERR